MLHRSDEDWLVCTVYQAEHKAFARPIHAPTEKVIKFALKLFENQRVIELFSEILSNNQSRSTCMPAACVVR